MTGYVRKTKPRPMHIVIPQPDWVAMIYEVKRAGYSSTSIEAATGITKDKANAILAGSSRMLWAHGQALSLFVTQIREGTVNAR